MKEYPFFQQGAWKKKKREREREIKETRKENENEDENLKGQGKNGWREENDASMIWIVILGNYDTLRTQLNLGLKYLFFLKP